MAIVHKNLVEEERGIIVHGVNAQGKFGAGFAKQLSQKYPHVMLDYLHKYRTTGLHLGDIITTHIWKDLYIVSGVTQQYYGRNPHVTYVSYPAIKTVFEKVNVLALELNLPVKFPLIGCGLANGEWSIVREIIRGALDPSIDASLYVSP
jgi:O-acetyl-ADP-ribose deacetylase (regulator of RNase III)